MITEKELDEILQNKDYHNAKLNDFDTLLEFFSEKKLTFQYSLYTKNHILEKNNNSNKGYY